MKDKSLIRHFANFFSMTYCFHCIFYWESFRYLSESTVYNFCGWLGLNFIMALCYAFFIEWLQGELSGAKVSWSDIWAGVTGNIVAAGLIPIFGKVDWLFWILAAVFLYTSYLGVKPLLLIIKNRYQ